MDGKLPSCRGGLPAAWCVHHLSGLSDTANVETFAQYIFLRISCRALDAREIFVNENYEYESVVSLVSKRYMRAGIGNERLLVCLSEYLPLRIVYPKSSMSTIGKRFVSRIYRRILREMLNIFDYAGVLA